MMGLRPKTLYYLIEGLSGFSLPFYYNYLFFYMQHVYGFTKGQNLLLCSLYGLVYMIATRYGGRLAHRVGESRILGVGTAVVLLTMFGAWLSHSLTALVVLFGLWTVGVALIWPALEGLICQGETGAGLSKSIGLYNVIWAALWAVAYFFGGALIEWLGWNCIFWIPVIILGLQLIFIGVLPYVQDSHFEPEKPDPTPENTQNHPDSLPPATQRLFLRMAWVANPLSYMAMNTVIPLVPDIAQRLGLSPMLAGFIYSIVFIMRTLTFGILHFWSGWQYRASWFFGTCILLVISFVAITTASNLWVLILAQLAFGWALGLIYSSSLYYSMDASQAKAEFGGYHESAIGAGIFAGPFLGWMSNRVFPHLAHASVWGVGWVLFIGYFGLFVLWIRHRRGIHR